jgi:hypothetical protein
MNSERLLPWISAARIDEIALILLSSDVDGHIAGSTN